MTVSIISLSLDNKACFLNVKWQKMWRFLFFPCTTFGGRQTLCCSVDLMFLWIFCLMSLQLRWMLMILFILYAFFFLFSHHQVFQHILHIFVVVVFSCFVKKSHKSRLIEMHIQVVSAIICLIYFNYQVMVINVNAVWILFRVNETPDLHKIYIHLLQGS